jgi:hypothetical protein
VGYGATPWNEAMNYAGSKQISMGKRFLEHYQWHKFVPMTEAVGWAESSASVGLGDWIWFPEGDPTRDAPIEARYFRRTFDIADRSQVRRATLRVGGDDQFHVWVNGHDHGAGGGWNPGGHYMVTLDIVNGRNVLAIRGENLKAPVTANPAGLIVGLTLEMKDGSVSTIRSGGDWKVSKAGAEGWSGAKFDDASWMGAKVIAAKGGGPWGKLEEKGEDAAFAPSAAGILGKVVIAYALEDRDVVVSGLKPMGKYRASFFDPVTGRTEKVREVQADGQGKWKTEPPGYGHDWALAVEGGR